MSKFAFNAIFLLSIWISQGFADPKKEGLELHNKYRALHEDTPPLQFSSDISLFSQKWAEKLLRAKTLYHSKNSGYGENLWMCYGCKYSSEEAVRQAVEGWYNEIRLYSWNHPGFSSKTGHFTALIWKNAKLVGFGIARDRNAIVVTANYSPVTNLVGQFKANVKPKKLQQQQTHSRPTQTPAPAKKLDKVTRPLTLSVTPAVTQSQVRPQKSGWHCEYRSSRT